MSKSWEPRASGNCEYLTVRYVIRSGDQPNQGILRAVKRSPPGEKAIAGLLAISFVGLIDATSNTS